VEEESLMHENYSDISVTCQVRHTIITFDSRITEDDQTREMLIVVDVIDVLKQTESLITIHVHENRL